MSWNLLAYALPAYGCLGLVARVQPVWYKKYEEMPLSDQSTAVNAIIEPVLNAENIEGSEHFERIQDMLQELPDSISPKTIPSLLQYRFKVIKTERNDYPVFATGTDNKNGKYYIGMKLDPEMEAALPWIITHELSHILNDDELGRSATKTIVSLAATALSTFILGWSLLPTLGAVLLTNCVTHMICTQLIERSADDFAIEHCSKEQLENGISFLEIVKARRVKGTYASTLLSGMFYPSEDSRIAKIRKALASSGKEKVA